MSQLYFEASMDATRLLKEVDKISARLGSLPSAAEKSANKMDKTFRRAATAIGGYFSLRMFAQAGAGIYNFSKDYETAMTEVGTISDEVFGKFPQYQQQVLDLSTKGSQSPKDLANALYQIVSAGYDGAEGLAVLEASARSSTGGFVETKVAADGITTVLNAWGKSFTEAGAVSDIFFKTVEKGKTTMPELASGIAQVAPIASTLKLPFEEIMGLMASITKQGTPTSLAFTQIRSALVGLSKEYGDNIFQGRTLQETFEAVGQEAEFSIEKLTAAVGRVEGANAILATTGPKLKGAFSDLDAIANKSLGATDAAVKKVEETTEDTLARLKNSILAAIAPVGDGIVKQVGEIAKGLNAAFSDGSIHEFLSDFAKAAKVAAAVTLAFNASLVAGKITSMSYTAALKVMYAQDAVLNRLKKLSTVSQLGYNAAQVSGAGTTWTLNAALKGLWVTMLANPFTAIIAVAGLAAAAFAIFRDKAKDAADIQAEFNQMQKDLDKFQVDLEPMINRYKELSEKQTLTNKEQSEFVGLIEVLGKKVPGVIERIDEYGNAVSLAGDKLSVFSTQQNEAFKKIAEGGIQDATKSLVIQEAKLREARSMSSDTYEKYDSSSGTYDTVNRSIEDQATAAARVVKITNEIATLRETIASYETQINHIDLKPFMLAHKDLFGDVDSLADDEINDMQNKLEQLYDVAPNDTAKAKIGTQIELLIDEMASRMGEAEIKNPVKGEVKFDLAEFEKDLSKKEKLYDSHNIVTAQKGKEFADKAFSSLLSEGDDYEDFLRRKLDAYKSNVAAQIAIAEAAESGDIKLKDVDSERLKVKTFDFDSEISLFSADKEIKSLRVIEKGLDDRVLKSIEKVQKAAAKVPKELNSSGDLEKAVDLGWQIADGMHIAADAAGAFNGQAGEALASLAQNTDSVMNVVTGLASGNYLQAASGVATILTDSANKKAEHAAEVAALQIQAVNEMLESQNRQLDLYIDKMSGLTGTERYEAEKATLGLINEQADALEKMASESKLNLTGKGTLTSKSGEEYDGTLHTSIGFSGLEDIEKFIEENKLQDLLNGKGFSGVDAFDADLDWVADDVDAIYKLYDDFKELAEQKRQIMEKLTGTTTSGITDSIAQGFANGQRSIEDFAQSFEDLMKEAMINNFKNQYVLKESEAFFQSFGAAAEDGYTSDEIAKLKAEWANSIEGLGEQFKAYEEISSDVFGKDIFGDAEKAKAGLSGSIQNIKEETANILSGQVNSIIMNMSKSIDLQTQMAASLSNIDRNTDHLDAIDRNIETMSENISSMAQAGGDRAFGNV